MHRLGEDTLSKQYKRSLDTNGGRKCAKDMIEKPPESIMESPIFHC